MSSTFDVLDQDTGCKLLTNVLCLVTIGFKSGNSKYRHLKYRTIKE